MCNLLTPRPMHGEFADRCQLSQFIHLNCLIICSLIRLMQRCAACIKPIVMHKQRHPWSGTQMCSVINDPLMTGHSGLYLVTRLYRRLVRSLIQYKLRCASSQTVSNLRLILAASCP